MHKFYTCRKDPKLCTKCRFCLNYIRCPTGGVGIPESCADCKLCYVACPYQAIERVRDSKPRKFVKLKVNGEEFEVPERVTLKKALEIAGFKTKKFLDEEGIFFPCETGGCYACSALVNGKIKPLCTTIVQEGMQVNLTIPEDLDPLRIVSGFMGHPVGGVGTPYWLKKDMWQFIEVACFAHGCNLRCPQCQNYHVTYSNMENPMTPREAAEVLTAYRRYYGVNRMAISGGEPTLNKRWLILFFKELKRLNRDHDARLHLDTNATILTPSYVEELVEAGVTDIGPDIKGLHVDTFMKITGLQDEELAKRYLKNEWEITKFMIDKYYPDRLFVGIGIPYNKYFMSISELREIGDKIVEINDEVQVCLLDYYPTFRRRDMKRPTIDEMKEARAVLKEAGLKIVIAQTEAGYIGP